MDSNHDIVPTSDYETTQLIFDMVQAWSNRGDTTSLYEWDARCKAVILRMMQWLDTPNVELRGRAAGEGPVERSGTNLSAVLGAGD